MINKTRNLLIVILAIGLSIFYYTFGPICFSSDYVGVYYNNHNGCEQTLRLNKDKTYKYLATYKGKKIEDYGKWAPSTAQGSCRITFTIGNILNLIIGI